MSGMVAADAFGQKPGQRIGLMCLASRTVAICI